MSKRQIIMLIGVWVIVFLFLGLPELWHKILAIVTGVALVAIAYTLNSEYVADPQNPNIPYAEHKSEVISSEVESPAAAPEDITNSNTPFS